MRGREKIGEIWKLRSLAAGRGMWYNKEIRSGAATGNREENVKCRGGGLLFGGECGIVGAETEDSMFLHYPSARKAPEEVLAPQGLPLPDFTARRAGPARAAVFSQRSSLLHM